MLWARAWAGNDFDSSAPARSSTVAAWGGEEGLEGEVVFGGFGVGADGAGFGVVLVGDDFFDGEFFAPFLAGEGRADEADFFEGGFVAGVVDLEVVGDAEEGHEVDGVGVEEGGSFVFAEFGEVGEGGAEGEAVGAGDEAGEVGDGAI